MQLVGLNLGLVRENVRRFFRRKLVVLMFSVLLVALVIIIVGAMVYNVMQMQSQVGVTPYFPP
ncbi:MAG: hypothetical protein QXM22_00870 [Candidatus Bathyarchaeia archaeon]